MPPGRRASAAASHLPSSAATSVTRVNVHRTNESQHLYAPPVPSGSSSMNGYNGPVSSPHQGMIQLLVNRLKNKLPCYSGLTIVDIEAEDAIQQTIESLRELSREFSDFVAWTLADMLNNLSKRTDSSGYLNNEILQSQLFVLKVLCVCLGSRWPTSDDSRPTTRNDDYATSGPNTPVELSSPTGSRPRVKLSRETMSSTTITATDLPPLNEDCAKYLLSVMVLFVRQTAPNDVGDQEPTLTHHHFEVDNQPRVVVLPDNPDAFQPSHTYPYAFQAVRTRASHTSFGSSGARGPSQVPVPPEARSYTNTVTSMAETASSLNVLIGKYAGIVIYHLSASNWPVVFARVRMKIHALEKIERSMPDVVDLQLMTECALDRSRLIQLLQEVSSLYLTMKRDAQLVLALPLAAAIWHWIDLYPDEFADAISGPRRLEGAPERVFDLMHQHMQPESKHLLWPTLTVLMCISFERLNQDFNIEGGGSRKTNRKEVLLVESLIKHTFSSSHKHASAALRCLLDIGKAASRATFRRDVPLRTLVLDVTHEIQNALLKYPHQRPFWESSDDIDVAMYADALVILWRFQPEVESIKLFRECLLAERSDAVKICAVTAMHTLAREAQQFPDHLTPFALWHEVADRLRAIFQASSYRKGESDNGMTRRAASRPKSKGYATQRLADRELLLVAILALWRADVTLYFLGLRVPDSQSSSAFLPIGTVVWDNANEAMVKLAMTRSFNFLVDTAFIMQPGDAFIELVTAYLPKLAPNYIFTACSHLYHARIDSEAQEMWITTLENLLKTYIRPSQYEHIQGIKQAEERVPAFLLSEMILLVSLTSVNNKVSMVATQALRVLARAEKETGLTHHSINGGDEGAIRLQVYEQLADPKVAVIGRVGYQKRMRKLVSRLAVPTPIYMAVWQECFFRWNEISKLHPNLRTDRNDGRTAMLARPISQEEIHNQWRNLTLFLAAFGAVCVPEVPYEHDALADYIPTEYMPDTTRILMNPEAMIESFLTAMLMNLLSPHIQIRDIAREALGTELSPRIYPKLYKKVEEYVNHLTNSSDIEWGEQYPVLVEQFSVLFKTLVENFTVLTVDERLHVSFGNSLLLLSRFIDRFEHDVTPLRVRIKFCSLIEVAAKRVDPSGLLRRETFAGHEILEMIATWVKEPPSYDEEAGQQQRELNVACLRALVAILERCPVPPDNGTRGEERLNYMTRFGFRFSDLLLHILELHGTSVEDDAASGQTSSSHRQRVIKADMEVRELVLNGIVYIVSANPEKAIKHNFYRAFAEDVDLRILCLTIFGRALRRGAKTELEPLDPGKPKHRLSDLVKQNLSLALAICETCPAGEVDLIIPVLFNIFESRTSLMELLKVMIDREVNNTDSEAELFRGNSMCTRMLSYFGKIHGYYYLRQLIRHLVDAMTSAPPECQYELDPARVGEHMAQQNAETIKRVATAFLEMIQGSVPALPSMFREICAHIANKVQETYPEAKFAALGAFIFLRFISPAIVSPEVVDIQVPRDDGGNIRRGLMIIAKIIQNLANNIFFGKEVYMTVLNEYLREHIVTVTRYLSELNKYVPPTREESEDEWLGTSCDESDILVLHRFFDSHIDKIGKEILSIEKGQDSAGPVLWTDLCEALVELTQPGDAPKLPTAPSIEHEPYIELTERLANRTTEPVREIFKEIPTENDHPALFVLAMNAMDVETLDIDLLLYHMFKLLSTPLNLKRKYEIIFDFTKFTASSEIPVQWLKYCLEMTPADIRGRFTDAHILNPNQIAQRYLRRLYNVSAAAGPSAVFKQHMSVAELQEHVSVSLRMHLSAAYALEEEPYQEFTEVGMRQASQLRLLANIRIGTTHLRITSLKAQPISPTLSCKTVDIVDLADVSDVYNVSVSNDGHEFIIRQRQGLTIYFNSMEREAIVKAVRDARGKLRGLRLAGVERAAKHQSNLVASLLTIGMSNICHPNHDLRVVAMELLEALCVELKAEEAMEIATRASVPYNPAVFIMHVSEYLAHVFPYLTLDLLSEVCTTLEKLPVGARLQSIVNISPWVSNLQLFSNPINPLYEPSGARLRDCVRLLVDLTTNDQDLSLALQRNVWGEVAKSDQTFIFVVLDELVRAAVDAGVATRRCQIIGETVATISSIGVRGRIFSKIRKVFGKTLTKATQNLAENAHWGEIAALTYMALTSSVHFKHPSQVQMYVPEVANLVSHVAGSGELLVRRTVHAIVVNLIESMQHFVTEDALRSTYRDLLRECSDPQTLQCFGLQRQHTMSDLIEWDPSGSPIIMDLISLDLRENLTRFLVKIMKAASGSQGLLNVWRARWMSLVTATSFQHSPCIQSRTFAVIGVLATGDVDDDLLYQMLVAFKQGLAQSDEARISAVVTMLRCITQVVPVLAPDSRYLPQLFWLGFALVQSSAMAFYAEATRLMQKSLETMDKHGAFTRESVSTVLLEARGPLQEHGEQLDNMLSLTFKSNFSFALVAPIFKGLRVKTLRESAENVLRCLLKVTTTEKSAPSAAWIASETVQPESLGYFLSLLSTCSTRNQYVRLLEDARVSTAWSSEAAGRPEGSVPRIPFDLLGAQDRDSVLLATTFISVMLSTAQGDDEESEILYCLLSEIAEQYPDHVSLAYEGLQDRIKDTIQNSVNPTVLGAASHIFRTAVQESYRSGLARHSASTLNTIEENGFGNGDGTRRRHLERLGMAGLAETFTFLRPGEGYATTLMRWIPDLVQDIIGSQ